MQDENSIRVVESTVGMMAHWAPSFGDRAFYFDAFLSHNANDQFAQNVAEMLQQLDVRIWGDANGDMSSRRVTGRITHALYSSRYVVVCVSSTYRDSPWMKAEYLNALKIEAQAPGSRVIVVCPDNYAANTNVPEALRHAPTYIVSNNTDAALLASCVSSGNRLPAGMVSRPGKRQEGKLDHAWLIHAKDRIFHVESQPLALRLLAAAFFEHVLPQTLMGARCALCDKDFAPMAQSLDDDQRRFLYESGCWFALSPSTDDRANGLMILGRLDQLALAPSARTFLFEVLANETNGPVLRCLSEWLTNLSTSELIDRLPALAHYALLDESLFEDNSSLTKIRYELPEALRVRIVVGQTLDLGLLGCAERATLAVEQLSYHLESNSQDEESKYLSVDVELVLRDLYDILIEHDTPRQIPDGTKVEELFVIAAERVATLWEGSRAEEMAGLAEWIPDFVAIPLLWVARAPQLRTQAVDVYLRICSALKRIPCRVELGAALANAVHSKPPRSFHEAEEAVGSAIKGARWRV